MPFPFLQDVSKHQRRAKLSSLFAGVLFGFGWLVFLDASAWSGHFKTADGWKIVWINGSPLALATVFLIALNLLDIDDLRQARYEYGLGGRGKWSVCWICVSSCIGFAAVACSIALLSQSASEQQKDDDSWLAGTAVCGCLFIVVAALVFWVGKGHEVTPL
mmetsp:Transcript_14279/g.28466  ORF Transcript_14279/g.28466 Transcript_14279/m.28466 type:complete len:161 (+) Transcript_14279:100-582(+)